MKLKSEDWGLLLPLLLLLAANSLVYELSDVVATSGFVSQAGPAQVPLLWAVDMLVTLIVASAFSSVVDRMPRTQLVGWLLGGFALSYLIIHLLFTYGAPASLNYFLLFIIADQQLIIFPLAFWSLANDVYTLTETKRLFPIIAIGSAIGSIIGNGLGAGSAFLFAAQQFEGYQLLVLGAVILLATILMVWLSFRRRTVRARQSVESNPSMRETIQIGLDFVENVPFFRYLALALLSLQLALTFTEYHFLASVNEATTSDPLSFQAFYGVYKIGFIIAMILFQWLIVRRYQDRVGLKNMFIVLPIAMAAAIGGAIALAGIWGAAGARTIARLVERGWDEPGRKAAQNLIPDERRGRVSVFMDTYFYAVSTLVGCGVLGILFLLSAVLSWSSQTVSYFYLGLAGLAAVVAIFLTIRMRSVYEKSLLDWRISRSRRKSVLDGIEF